MEGKARGFKHNPEVHDQLGILKTQKNEVSLMKKSFKGMFSQYKSMLLFFFIFVSLSYILEIAEQIDKGQKDYLFFITEGRQNPKLGTVYNMYADYLTKSNEARQTMVILLYLLLSEKTFSILYVHFVAFS